MGNLLDRENIDIYLERRRERGARERESERSERERERDRERERESERARERERETERERARESERETKRESKTSELFKSSLLKHLKPILKSKTTIFPNTYTFLFYTSILSYYTSISF